MALNSYQKQRGQERRMTDCQIVAEIIDALGGRQNIVSLVHCMTRLRVTVKAGDGVRKSMLENTDKVLGVVREDPEHWEVVVGPGNSKRFADIFYEMKTPEGEMKTPDKENPAKAGAVHTRKKPKDALKLLSDIFIPLIPGIIAAGLCGGMASLIEQVVLPNQNIAGLTLLCQLLRGIQASFMTYIMAWTGYRTAERCGATPILGGMLGMVSSLDQINEIAKILGMYNESNPLCSVLRSGKGGVLSVICSVLILSVVEKWIRRRMPANLDVIFTPFLSLLICAVPHILIVMPAIGYASSGIVWLLNETCASDYIVVRMLVGYAAAALFLPLAAAGMHHGLVGLYAIQLEELGCVTIYPALAMAGAGQVGAAIALYRKGKRVHNQRLCSVIGGALPAGLLGVGEPLIYGVTLPMGRPFLTAGLGAGFGGAFVMACQVSSTAWGTSGLLATLVMTSGQGGAARSMTNYVIGLCISYVMGYLITGIRISDAEVENALGGTGQIRHTDASEEGMRDAGSAVESEESTYRKVRHGETISLNWASYSFTHIVKNPAGIHARPAGELVKLMDGFDAEIHIRNDERSAASAKSVIELMLLDAQQGSKLQVSVTGRQAREAQQALQQFMNAKL